MNGKYNTITMDFINKWDNNFLLDILDDISDIVMINDLDTRIVYVNKAYEKILGVPQKKAIGKKLSDIEPNATAIKVMNRGIASHYIVEELKSVGISAVGVSFPMFKEGILMGAVSIFNDLTQLNALSEELHRTQEISKYYQDQLEKRKLSPSFSEYVCTNEKTREVLFLASKVAKTDSTILIRGESGVGKEVLARAICRESKRSAMPFIKVNCASIPENLLESELFGYDEGAFTGARKGGKLGKFELAKGGTIFLDEIGDMTFNMQAKILRVIQEKEFERVGGTKTLPLDVRIITATNRDLESMIADGTFRSDLYYRLNVIPLNLPSLRERKDDIIPLSRTILENLNKGCGESVTISPEVAILFQKYDWPGNIRELGNVLEHGNIVRSGDRIEIKDLPKYLLPYKLDIGNESFETFDLKTNIEILEKGLIKESLKRNNFNKSKAMDELGISRRNFYEKLARYELADFCDENSKTAK